MLNNGDRLNKNQGSRHFFGYNLENGEKRMKFNFWIICLIFLTFFDH